MSTSLETATKTKAPKAKASKSAVPSTAEAFIIDYIGTKPEVNKALEHLAQAGYSLSGLTLSKDSSWIGSPIYTVLGIATKLT